MSLPNLPYDDTLRREVRTEWGGLNLNENAGDGELIEALNLSSRAYPLLATRKPWYMKPINQTGAPTIKNAAAFGASRYWFWVSEDPENAGTYKFYYNGTPKGTLSGDREIASRTRFACLRDKIYVLPAEKVYDELAGTWEDMELARANLTARFMDGEYAGVPAKANTIYVATGTWQFNVGDAVTISGCTIVPENNKTAVIREISGKYLRFYENTFSLRPLWRYDVSGSLAAGRSFGVSLSASPSTARPLSSTFPPGFPTVTGCIGWTTCCASASGERRRRSQPPRGTPVRSSVSTMRPSPTTRPA